MAFRVDNSSSTGVKPTREAIGPSPDSFYQNETVLEADMMNMAIDEICNAVEGAGIALDKEAGAAPPNDNQLLAAIKALQKTVANPFVNYAQFRHEETSGANGGSYAAADTWQDRTINVTVDNNIGASLAGDAMTLVAGDYVIEARFSVTQCGISRLGLWDDTAAAFIDFGMSSNDGDSVGAVIHMRSKKFTIGVSSDIKIQMRGTAAQPTNGFGSNVSAGVNEQYGDIKIFKLD